MAELETWESIVAATIYVNRITADGSKAQEPIPGHSTFNISAEQRIAHQRACKDRYDPFLNGSFRLVAGEAADIQAAHDRAAAQAAAQAAESAAAAAAAEPTGAAADLAGFKRQVLGLFAAFEASLNGTEPEPGPDPAAPAGPATSFLDAPEVNAVEQARAAEAAPSGANPNVLTDEEMSTVLAGHHKTAGKILDRMTSPAALSNLLSRARQESSQARQAQINDRLHAVDPMAIGLPGTNEGADASDDVAVHAATVVDVEGLHDPAEIDLSRPPVASPTGPSVPPPAPLPPDLAAAYRTD